MARTVYPEPLTTTRLLWTIKDDGRTWTNTFYCNTVVNPSALEDYCDYTVPLLKAIYPESTFIDRIAANSGKAERVNGKWRWIPDGLFQDSVMIQVFCLNGNPGTYLPRFNVIDAQFDGSNTPITTNQFPVKIDTESITAGVLSTTAVNSWNAKIQPLLANEDYVLCNNKGQPYNEVQTNILPGIQRRMR